MTYCRKCGSPLEEGARFCPNCGSPADALPTAEGQMAAARESGPEKKKRPLYKKWWFWVLVLALAGSVLARGGTRNAAKTSPERTAPSVTAAAVKPTAAPTQAPTAVPTEPPEETGPAEEEIRPEVREFLDAYEACMNEYVEFMRKYMNSDPASMASMIGDYYSILSRYTRFAEKIDALDESQLTNAELAYYLEVTGRVNKALLSVAG